MYRKTIKQLKDRAVELGARDSKVIEVRTVGTAAKESKGHFQVTLCVN